MPPQYHYHQNKGSYLPPYQKPSLTPHEDAAHLPVPFHSTLPAPTYIGAIARLYPLSSASFPPAIAHRNPDFYYPASTIPPAEEDPGFPPRDQAYVELHFSRPPKHADGYIFGHDPELCDVVMGKSRGMHAAHFAITYSSDFSDGLARLIVQDLGTTTGISVQYGSVGTEFRSSCRWTLSGYRFIDTRDIVIISAEGNDLLIVPMLYDTEDPAVLAAIERLTADKPWFEMPEGLRMKDTELEIVNKTPMWVTEHMLTPMELSLNNTTQKLWNPQSGLAFAVKTVYLKTPSDAKESEELKEKISKYAALKHPNLLAVADTQVFQDRSRVFFPWHSYGNLARQNQALELTLGESLSVFRQALSALSFLHSQTPTPLVHGNLRPENILIQTRGHCLESDRLRIALSDFSICKTERDPYSHGALHYRAPELIASSSSWLGRPEPDVWSLGLIMLNLIYSRGYDKVPAPYRLRYCFQLHQFVRSPDSFSDPLVRILGLCLDYNVYTRKTAASVSEALTRLLAGHLGTSAQDSDSGDVLYAGILDDSAGFERERERWLAMGMKKKKTKRGKKKLSLVHLQQNGEASSSLDGEEEEKMTSRRRGRRGRPRVFLLPTIWEEEVEGGEEAGEEGGEDQEGVENTG